VHGLGTPRCIRRPGGAGVRARRDWSAWFDMRCWLSGAWTAMGGDRGERGCHGLGVGWRLPALWAALVVVALALGGAIAGQLIGGVDGAAVGAVSGALSGVVAGFIPSLRDGAERRRAERARLEEDRAEDRAAWQAAGEAPDAVGMSGVAAVLRASRAVVAFAGREDELAVLRAWCAAGRERSVRVLVGAGGVGKTRLARQVAEEWAADGREWRLVAAGKEEQAVGAARKATSGPVLLVVDYAETRAGLGALLEEVLAGRGVIRVLLIARSLGEWWERLVEESAPAVGGLLAEAPPLRLDVQVTPGMSNAALAAAAVPHLARALGVQAPSRTEFEDRAEPVPILVVHVAALVAVLRYQTAEPGASLRVTVTERVLDELLEHEARYWRRTADAWRLSGSGPLVKPAVAAATLLGATGVAEAAQVLARVPDLSGSPLAQRRQWARWLYGLYPPDADGRLGPVQPDLLAERHVTGQLAADPELARACSRELSPQQAEHALTVLARAWAHQEQAPAVIAAALRADLAGLALPAAAVAVQTRAELGGLLAAALRDAAIAPEDLARITDGLPGQSIVLTEAALAAVSRMLKALPPDADPLTRTEWLEREAGLLYEVGRAADALAAGLQVLTIRRELAAADPGRHLPGLAGLLSGLGILFCDLDCADDAVRASEEAVTLYRELDAAQPGRYRSEIATSLGNLAGTFYPLGRHADALAATREAVAIRRELAVCSPGSDQAGLAGSLHNLGLALSALGCPADALQATQEAVAISRGLAATQPDRYRGELALSLNNLSIHLAELGRTADALLATREALAIRRELAAVSPGRYRSSVAQSLANLGDQLADLARPDEALAATEEAVSIYREMNAAGPAWWRARTGLATTLDHLSVRLAALGRPADALTACQEAVTAYRELAAATPARWRANLATALDHLGTHYADLNRPADALEAVRGAVTLYREAVSANPAPNRPGLAAALNSLSKLLLDLGCPADALPVAQESTAISRELAAQIPARYRPFLAVSLGNLAAALSALGRQADAMAVRAEAQGAASPP
jgi:tetratricopeptide (TPR) repeat protein